MTEERVRVESFEHLFKILEETGGYHTFCIQLNYGLISRFEMQLFPDAPDKRFKDGKTDKIDILHCNAGHWHTVTKNQLKNPDYSNIPTAIEKGAFYWPREKVSKRFLKLTEDIGGRVNDG